MLLRKIASYGDPRLYALSRVSEHLSHSTQPLVPERVFMAGGRATANGNGSTPERRRAACSACWSACWWPRSRGFQLGLDSPELADLRSYAEKIAADAAPNGEGKPLVGLKA